MRRTLLLASPLLALALLSVAVGCKKGLSPEAQQAQDAAKAASDRVAALEAQIAEIKTGKHHSAAASREDAEALGNDQMKALQRQLADAKRRATDKTKSAQELARSSAAASKTTVVEVPVGAALEVQLSKDLSTETVQAGDTWSGTLAAPVSVGAQVVWPAGTAVKGVVSQSTPAGKLSSGNGGLAIKLTEVANSDVDAGVYLVAGDKRGSRNAKFIGGGAALGALIGVLSDKKNQGDHALGGAALGAAAGTALAAGTSDTVIKIPADKPVNFTLTVAEKVTVKL